MSKKILLIVYLIGFLFTQQGLEACSHNAFSERSGNYLQHTLILKSVIKPGGCSVNSKAVSLTSNIDLEDGELKAKIISAGDLFYHFIDLRHLNVIELTEYSVLNRPILSLALFKLNRVFRL